MNDNVDAPSRQTHREIRAAYRRAKLRQRLVGIPLAIVGVALIVLGVSSYLDNQSSGTGDVRVEGVTIERPTSSVTVSSTSGPPEDTPSSLGNLPMPGTGEDAPALPSSAPTPR